MYSIIAIMPFKIDCHLTDREREKTADIDKITRKVEIPKHNEHAARAARRAQKIAKQQEGTVKKRKTNKQTNKTKQNKNYLLSLFYLLIHKFWFDV